MPLLVNEMTDSVASQAAAIDRLCTPEENNGLSLSAHLEQLAAGTRFFAGIFNARLLAIAAVSAQGELLALAVHPATRRRGVGARLLGCVRETLGQMPALHPALPEQVQQCWQHVAGQ